MRSQPASLPRVHIHTLGCPKNEADSRALVRGLQAAGVVVVQEPEASTHIIVNTCGFIRDAKEESIAAILNACAGYPERPVLVLGCLVERYGPALAEGIPEVSQWLGLVGPETRARLEQFLLSERVLGSGGRTGSGPRSGEVTLAKDEGQTGEVAQSGHGTQTGDGAEMWDARLGPEAPARASYAYLKISDGCDESCSFCAIPAIKGPYQSVSLSDIVDEAGRCLAEGARELVLVGQDTSRWADRGLSLADLVDVLAADERVRRIRVMYLQPEGVTDDYLRYMGSQPKLCRYLDVPFQHSHPDLLRKMGRWGDDGAYLGLLERARRLMPDISVRSTFIVGFPGEKKAHFDHLLRFVEAAQYDYAGGFVYSPEDGTKAAELRPRVSSSLATERLNRLEAVLADCAERRHQNLIGSRVEVMIDTIDPQEAGEEAIALGRTAGQAPDVDGVTYVEGRVPEGIGPGDVVEVEVTAAVGYDLIGECNGAP